MELSKLNLSEVKESLLAQLKRISTPQDVEILKRDWLSKEGTLKLLFKQLRDIPAERKPEVAAGLNDLKQLLEQFVSEQEQRLAADLREKSARSEFVDLSLPSRWSGLGSVHPISLVERRIAEILRPFGFRNVLGPEVETEYYCFDSLNIPPHHPARDMQDTYYTANGLVLRTHTTSVQARELQKGGLPVKVASFGRVYRNETEDASHQAMFHQFELVWLEAGLTLSHLMGLISHILKELYGKRRKVKFVPKFYPYTEPSIGPQVDCTFCKGSGCPACGGAGWVTIAGAGMVHRNVLREFGYDPEKVSGFAFGLGTSRLASQFSGISALKTLYDNDLRLLKERA
ncbi:MAG: phenylalanine--tRNA ligase subunit alpha [Oligoflexia bacterium]|nr:phenylalanine--tRNA ligase subunit alpha [Oligoflexia bacterium]